MAMAHGALLAAGRMIRREFYLYTLNLKQTEVESSGKKYAFKYINNTITL
jgi:hypothetical protein